MGYKLMFSLYKKMPISLDLPILTRTNIVFLPRTDNTVTTIGTYKKILGYFLIFCNEEKDTYICGTYIFTYRDILINPV